MHSRCHSKTAIATAIWCLTWTRILRYWRSVKKMPWATEFAFASR